MPNCQTCKCLATCGLNLGFTNLVNTYPEKLTPFPYESGWISTTNIKEAIGEFLATQLCGNYVPEEG